MLSVRYSLVGSTVIAKSFVRGFFSCYHSQLCRSFVTESNAKPETEYSKVIGIDLGTTNSAVALVEGQKPRILENAEGARTTPSTVAFTKNGDVLVGEPAKRQAVLNSENTFYATKRLIGRKFDDEEVQNDSKNVSYKIVKHDNGDAWVQTTVGNNVSYSPSQIGGLVLKEMKKIAEQDLALKIKNAVITVPAYFNDSQRQATKTAGELVGLNVVRIVNEPTAASLAYGLNQNKNGTVAVYDLGGGTFDISILDIDDGVFEVRSTNGDTHLGGEDFDNLLVSYILKKFKEDQKSNVDITKNKMAMQRIKEAAEKAKIELSHVHVTRIQIPFLTSTDSVDFELKESELDNLSMHLIKKTLGPLKTALSDADLEKSDIDEIIMVGGMTRMPRIRKLVSDFFGKTPNVKVNPDEAVALGAAIQGAVLSGEVKDVLLLDVTPLTLGIETYGGLFSPLIPRGTTVPCKINTTYSTAVDGQNSIDINVYQGERPLIKDNKLIGKFKLSGIPPKPKGVPKIEVSFDIDADGIIKVSAADKESGKKSSITVFGKTGMSKEEIDNLVKKSKETTKEDQIRMNYLKHVNNLELIVFDSEQAMENLSAFITQQEKTTLDKKISIVKRMIEDSRKGDLFNVKLIKAAQDELKDETMEVIGNAGKRSRHAYHKGKADPKDN